MPEQVELPSDVELISLRRCTNSRPCSDSIKGKTAEICGWRAFDEVNLLIDISKK